MMAGTYSEMKELRRGIYNFNILKAAASFYPDKHYGGLILPSPLLNAIAFLFLPFYCCIKDKAKLKRLNSGLYKLYYSGFLIILTAAFLVLNLAMMPFAYLKTSFYSMRLVI